MMINGALHCTTFAFTVALELTRFCWDFCFCWHVVYSHHCCQMVELYDVSSLWFFCNVPLFGTLRPYCFFLTRWQFCWRSIKWYHCVCVCDVHWVGKYIGPNNRLWLLKLLHLFENVKNNYMHASIYQLYQLHVDTSQVSTGMNCDIVEPFSCILSLCIWV